uniref:Uncharacterized protein n=1 Tax=Anguilla anguilla TaxID=7936 RepID=A0A0E9QM75_ANGAN
MHAGINGIDNVWMEKSRQLFVTQLPTATTG